MTSSHASQPDPVPALRDDGLDDAEGEVMDALVDAFESYVDLPVQHPDESSEFRYHVHMLQGLLACRVARRTHPEGWHSGADPPSRSVQGDGEADPVEAEKGTAEDKVGGQDEGESGEGDPSHEDEEAGAQGDDQSQDADRQGRPV